MTSKFRYRRGHKANDINMTLDHEQILFMNRLMILSKIS